MKKRHVTLKSGILLAAFVIGLSALFPVQSFAAKSATLSCPISSSTNQAVSCTVQNLYNKLPYSVAQKFKDLGWTIKIVSNQSLMNLYGYTSWNDQGFTLAGITSPSEQVIYLNDSEQYAISACNHEIGHFFDLYLAPEIIGTKVSDNEIFKQIYVREQAGSGMTQYMRSDIMEYFAECFKTYIELPAALKQKCPDTYGFISALVYSYSQANSAVAISQRHDASEASSYISRAASYIQ